MDIRHVDGIAQELTIIWPDDWHTHFRDGAPMQAIVPITARLFRRAVVMPNLVPAITTLDMLKRYEERVFTAATDFPDFQPVMTFALTDQTTPAEIKIYRRAGIRAGKLYPANATTNSAHGVSNLRRLAPTFMAMQDEGVLLLLHGETVSHNGQRTNPFRMESVFIQLELPWVLKNFPKLKVVLEHITTAEAAKLVLSNKHPNLAATITPHHLMYDVCDLFENGFQSALYCKPILKDASDKDALRLAAVSGHPKIFAGTDSAPHPLGKKSDPCGCAAGVFVGAAAISMYTQVFDEMNALKKLEGFLSVNGAKFYGMAVNDNTMRIVRKPWYPEPPMRIASVGEYWQIGYQPGRDDPAFAWSVEEPQKLAT